MSRDCDDITQLPSQAEIAPPPPPPPCETETVRPIPDELREPQSTIPPETRTYTPEPIIISNRPQTAVCPDPNTEGDSVTTPDGVFFEKFYFSTVLSLTENVLSYIAKHHIEPIIEKGIHAGTITIQELRRISGMTLAQAQELLAAAAIIQERQDTYALLAAKAKLVCLYWNKPQTAECIDEEMAHNGEHPDAVFSYTVPAHTYSSPYSQEAADDLARQQAETLIKCVYLSGEVTVDCVTRPERPAENMAPVPNDEEPIYPGRSLRVGQVTVPTGKYASETSKEEAEEKARQAGYALLNCWYPNRYVHRQCEDPDARAHKVKPGDEPQRHADIEKRTRGQIVDIPVGFITSDLSEDMATQEAEILAESLLECCFVNDPFKYSCDPQEVIYGDGTVELRYPDPEKGRTEVVVEEGQFTSCNSKEEANEIARQMSEGLLECMFCNGRVMPVCVPQWVTDGILAGDIELPLTDGLTYKGNVLKFATLPPEATVGEDAGKFCDPIAQQAQLVAEAAGGAKASSVDADCIYRNDLLYACCAGVNPVTKKEMQPNVLHSLVHPETGEPYLFYTMYSSDACIAHDYSYPNSKNDYVVVPVGLFSVGGVDMKDEANARAIEFARTMLYCVWANPKTLGTCEMNNLAISVCDNKWYVGKNIASSDQLVFWSNTSRRPVVLPRGYLRYIGVGGDEGQAFSTLWTTAQYFCASMIVCIYTNTTQMASCADTEMGPPRAEVYTEGRWTRYKYIQDGAMGEIPPYTVYASSPWEADLLARELADSIAACDVNTILIWSEDSMSQDAPPPWDAPGETTHPNGGYIPPPRPVQSEPESERLSSWSSPSSPSSTQQESSENGGGGGGGGGGDDCCFGACPLYLGGGGASTTRAISLVSEELIGQNTIILSVMSGIKRLDMRADALLENVDKLLQKQNG